MLNIQLEGIYKTQCTHTCEGKRPEPRAPPEHHSAMSPKMDSLLAVDSIGSFCLCLLHGATATQQVSDMLPVSWWHGESLCLVHFAQFCVCEVPLDSVDTCTLVPLIDMWCPPAIICHNKFINCVGHQVIYNLRLVPWALLEAVRYKALGINTHTVGGVNPDVECLSHRPVSVEYE